MFQAMLPHDFLQSDRLYSAGLDFFHSLLGQINVFQLLKIFENGLTCVVGLGASSTFGETGKALYDGTAQTAAPSA